MSDRSRSTVKVKVEILDPDAKLFPELAATVHFLASDSSNSPDAGRTFLFVSKSAVFKESGHDFVWVIQENNVLRKSQVEVTTTTDDLARVESGLKLHDAVVLNALKLKSLREYDTVRIAQ
jgi:hypothetical protein